MNNILFSKPFSKHETKLSVGQAIACVPGSYQQQHMFVREMQCWRSGNQPTFPVPPTAPHRRGTRNRKNKTEKVAYVGRTSRLGATMSSGPALPGRARRRLCVEALWDSPSPLPEPPTAHLHFWWDRSQASKMDGKPEWEWCSLGPEDLD